MNHKQSLEYPTDDCEISDEAKVFNLNYLIDFCFVITLLSGPNWTIFIWSHGATGSSGCARYQTPSVLPKRPLELGYDTSRYCLCLLLSTKVQSCCWTVISMSSMSSLGRQNQEISRRFFILHVPLDGVALKYLRLCKICISSARPPVVPELVSDDDTSHFDDVDRDNKMPEAFQVMFVEFLKIQL